MKLTEGKQRFFWWLRTMAMGVMGVAGTLAGLNLDILPAAVPQICGAAAAISGALATWAGSVLPGREIEAGNEKPNPEILE